jgi:hypothetical protein
VLFNTKKLVEKLRNNSLIQLWILYVIINLTSTILHGREFTDLVPVLLDVCLLFIILTLTSYTESSIVFEKIIRLMYCLSIVTLVTYVLHIDVFEVLKSESVYKGIFSGGGGASALFEYRHYYGVMLSCAFFMNLYYGKENRRFFTGCILISNIILTFTVNTWISFLLGVLIYVGKEVKPKVKLKYFLYFAAFLILVIFIIIFFHDVCVSVINSIMNRFDDLQVSLGNFEYGGMRGYSLICGVQYILENWKKYVLLGGGNGFAMTWLREHPYGTWTAAIDVQYVTVFMNCGILGLGVLIVLAFKELRMLLTKNRNEDAFLKALLILVMSVSFCFFEVFESCTSIYVFWLSILCLSEEHSRGNVS